MYPCAIEKMIESVVTCAILVFCFPVCDFYVIFPNVLHMCNDGPLLGSFYIDILHLDLVSTFDLFFFLQWPK